MLRNLAYRALRSLFRVQEGEGLRVGVMMLYSVAVVGGVIITGQLASRALFLSILPESAIPYKFILPPVVMVAVSAGYARAAGRLPTHRLIVAACALFMVGTLLFRLVLETPAGQGFAALCALFVFFDAMASLAILQFWAFAGEVFDARQAKRLFALIAGGSTLSNVLFGAVLGASARAVAPENLLYAVMASLGVCLACAAFLAHKYGATLYEEAPAGEKEELSLLESVRQVFGHPLMASMSGILVLIALASSIADYQLDLSLQAHYGEDGQGMVGFLGQFRFWAGLGAGVLQFFLAGRLLERFGLMAGLVLLPSGMALGAGAILLTGGLLWAAALPRACDVVLKYTVNDAAFNLLYLPLEARLRARARAVLKGMVEPPVVALLGLVFLWSGQQGSQTVVAWAYPLLGLVGLWLFLAKKASRQYVAALARSIQMRRLDPDREQIDLSDESSLRVIRQTLASPDPPKVVHALSLLPRIPRVDWTPQVAALLEHPHPEVRVQALEYLKVQQAAIYGELVHARLEDADERVRAAAIEAFCALGRAQVIERVLPFLKDPGPRLRASAILGLIQHAGLDGMLHAGEHLKALLTSPEPEARLEGARVLGVLQVRTFYQPLVLLLQDESLQVRIAALRAAGRLRAPELVPFLLPGLEAPATRPYAGEALLLCAGEDLSALAEPLKDKESPIALRQHLVQLIAQKSSPQVVQLLKELLGDQAAGVRQAAGAALLDLREEGHTLDLERGRLQALLLDEVQGAYALIVLGRDARGAHLLLDEALQVRAAQARERLLMLLDLLHEELAFSRVRQALLHRDGRLRAAALELIDNVVGRQERDLLLPLWGMSEGERLEVAQGLGLEHGSRMERLRQLAQGRDTWLRCCALHAIGQAGLAELGGVVEGALEDEEELVRETALAAAQRLQGTDGRLKELLKKLVARYQGGGPIMALSTLEKVFFLKGVPLFAQIPGEDIVGMVPILHEVQIEKGQTFIRKGEEGDCLYILVDGEVGVELEGGQDISRSREVLGERAVLSEQPRLADCVALSEVVALRIDKKDFWKLMEEQPKITIEILKVLVERYIR